MIKYLCFIFLLFISFASKETSPDRKHRFIVLDNEKYGMIDHKNNWIIKPMFSSPMFPIKALKRDYLLMFKNKKVRIYDLNKKLLGATEFDDLSPLNKDYIFALSNKKWGIVNKEGKWVLKPKFDNIQRNCPPVSVFLALIKNKYGIYNLKGEKILSFSLEETIWSLSNNRFLYYQDNNVSKIINSLGESLSTEFKVAIPLESFVIVCQLSNNKWGIVDINGKWVVPAIYDEKFFSLYYTYNFNVVFFRKKNEWVAIDGRNGNLLMPFINFGSNKVPMNINSKYIAARPYKRGKNNRYSIEIKFPDIYNREDGTKEILPYPVSHFAGEYVIYQKENKQSVLFLENKKEFPFEYEYIYPCLIEEPTFYIAGIGFNGMGIIKGDNKMGIINHKGEWIVKPDFDGIL